ncbi:hypothetical protein Ato02nite_006250 [Paractinoplanes toevensis]|uniref:Uncharacterized protein n=1 Tax=Paractinoplanes toevensis TaxID=571911 RepID=A0A919VYB8_9ACTN|nr:hypothetical protein Ato02nite_006250 [Actinoplanes toevensis]
MVARVNEFLAVRVGPRFVFVNLLPTFALTLLVGGLAAAGAPGVAPSWGRLSAFAVRIGWPGAMIGVFAVVVLSAVLHPLAYPMIQFLEGYWDGLPAGRALKLRASQRYHTWRIQLGELQSRSRQLVPDLAWLPPAMEPALPTRLGNALQAGEIRAGDRYGYRTGDILQRLIPIASPAVRTELSDTRNQLDTSARLCAFSLLAVPVTLFLLWSHGLWLLVPFGCYLFAWASYRAALAAAYRFCNAVSVAVDLYHLRLWDALSLQRPESFADEQRRMGPLLCQLLRDGRGLKSDAPLSYIPDADPSGTGAWEPTQTTLPVGDDRESRRRFFNRYGARRQQP